MHEVGVNRVLSWIVCKVERIKCNTQDWTGSSRYIRYQIKDWLGSQPEAHFIHMVWILAFLLDHNQANLPQNNDRDSL